jgi:hypothetical protein
MAGNEIRGNGPIGEIVSTRAYTLPEIFTNNQFFGGSVKFKDAWLSEKI